jgi:hypothetical protein
MAFVTCSSGRTIGKTHKHKGLAIKVWIQPHLVFWDLCEKIIMGPVFSKYVSFDLSVMILSVHFKWPVIMSEICNGPDACLKLELRS